MSDFKIGDRVRVEQVVGTSYSEFGTVTALPDNISIWYRVKLDGGSKTDWHFGGKEMTLIETAPVKRDFDTRATEAISALGDLHVNNMRVDEVLAVLVMLLKLGAARGEQRAVKALAALGD